jgi:hypothetical protein
MRCVLSSLVSTNPGVFKSLVFLNHFPWLVMCFENQESTYQTLLFNTPPIIDLPCAASQIVAHHLDY